MGKITVKHYLNKRIKEDDEPLFCEPPAYPIYYYITVNRRTINKPSGLALSLDDKTFEKGGIFPGVGNLKEVIKNERDIITKICELFITDYESGNVKTSYRYISSRGFTAKDEFINGLNSYIAFYTQSLFDLVYNYYDQEIPNYLISKLESSLGLSKFDYKYSLLKINITLGSLSSNRMIMFYKTNLDQEHFNLYFTARCLHSCLGSSSMQYGYDLPLIEWTNGDLKSLIFKTLSKKNNTAQEDLFKAQEFNKDFFDSYITPIIDKVCDVNNQVHTIFR